MLLVLGGLLSTGACDCSYASHTSWVVAFAGLLPLRWQAGQGSGMGHESCTYVVQQLSFGRLFLAFLHIQGPSMYGDPKGPVCGLY